MAGFRAACYDCKRTERTVPVGNDLFDIPVIPRVSSQPVATKDHKMTGSKNKP
jgi:hypothetical protein